MKQLRSCCSPVSNCLMEATRMVVARTVISRAWSWGSPQGAGVALTYIGNTAMCRSDKPFFFYSQRPRDSIRRVLQLPNLLTKI